MKWAWKTFCVAIPDSPVLKNVSTANTWYPSVQAIIVTEKKFDRLIWPHSSLV